MAYAVNEREQLVSRASLRTVGTSGKLVAFELSLHFFPLV
jgi:hypothetical protein